MIGNEENQDINFNTFIASLNEYNSIDINEVFNDKFIIDLLTVTTLKKLNEIFPTFISGLNSDTNYKNSYLAERIKTNA